MKCIDIIKVLQRGNVVQNPEVTDSVFLFAFLCIAKLTFKRSVGKRLKIS